MININLKECAIELFLKILFFMAYCPVKYIIQKMCNKAVDDSLTTLKDIPDWFVTSMIKSIICYKID